MPADTLWMFSMALNVYLTFFHRYSGEQLIALEPYYLAFNYGVPFIPAMVFVFAKTEERGRIFGDATVSFPSPSTISRSIPIVVRMTNPLLALVLGESRMEYSSRCYVLRPGLVSFGRGFFLILPTGCSGIHTQLLSLFILSFDLFGGEFNLARRAFCYFWNFLPPRQLFVCGLAHFLHLFLPFRSGHPHPP